MLMMVMMVYDLYTDLIPYRWYRTLPQQHLL